MSLVINDLDKDSKRNARGTLFRNRIAQIPEIDIAFGVQEQQDMEELLELLMPISFNVTFYSPQLGVEKTERFYASPHKPELIYDNPPLFDKMRVRLIGYDNLL